jgi:carbonic anhydrase
MIHKNVITEFSPEEHMPQVDPTAYVHPLAAVIGNVSIGKLVFVSPFASVRGDEGQPLHVGDESNVQDGVIIHALETFHEGHVVEKNLVEVKGKKYAVYIGNRVSLAHQAQIHGPASVGDDCFIGMNSLVFKSRIEDGCVIEPSCVIVGVTIKAGHYVPAGTVLSSQTEADRLPRQITEDYVFRSLNDGVVHVNTNLAAGYSKANLKL